MQKVCLSQNTATEVNEVNEVRHGSTPRPATLYACSRQAKYSAQGPAGSAINDRQLCIHIYEQVNKVHEVRRGVRSTTDNFAWIYRDENQTIGWQHKYENQKHKSHKTKSNRTWETEPC